MLAEYLEQLPTTEANKRFVDKSMQLSGLVYTAMQRKGLTQKALADLLGKKESEVSRWLSGLHNFTLKTITRLEVALGEDLVLAFRDSKQITTVLTKQAGCRSPITTSRWAEASFQETSDYLTCVARQANSSPESILTYADAA